MKQTLKDGLLPVLRVYNYLTSPKIMSDMISVRQSKVLPLAALNNKGFSCCFFTFFNLYSFFCII
jgi:hypothetical protein